MNLYKRQREAARRREADKQAQLREQIAAEAEQRRVVNEAHASWQDADSAARREATVVAGDDPGAKPSLVDTRAQRRRH